MARHPVFDALERFLHPKAVKSSLSEHDRQFLAAMSRGCRTA